MFKGGGGGGEGRGINRDLHGFTSKIKLRQGLANSWNVIHEPKSLTSNKNSRKQLPKGLMAVGQTLVSNSQTLTYYFTGIVWWTDNG